MEFTFEMKGFEENDDLLSYMISNLDKFNQDMLIALGETIVAEARSNLQNNTNIDSGTLLSSITILEEDDNEIIIGTREPYAGHIEYGRGPVRPLKEGGWLHWIDKDTGKDVFAKFANATEPMPFMEPAVIQHTTQFPNLYVNRIERFIHDKL